jgi:hypothetical protein
MGSMVETGHLSSYGSTGGFKLCNPLTVRAQQLGRLGVALDHHLVVARYELTHVKAKLETSFSLPGLNKG